MQIRSTTAKDGPSASPNRQRRHRQRHRQLPTPGASPSLESLPDDVLVAIGVSLAKLCGARDYLALSQTCHRLQHLLVESHETVHEILRFQTARLHRSLTLPSWCNSNSNSSSSKSRQSRRRQTSKLSAAPAVVVQSLEQLRVYESLESLELLEEHRILGIVGCSSNNRSSSGGAEDNNPNNNNNNNSNIVEIYDTWDLHRCLGMVMRAMERNLPTVVLDEDDSQDCARHRMQGRTHSVPKSTRTAAAAAASSVSMHMEKTKHYLHHDSYFCGKAVCKVLVEHLVRRNEASKNGFHWISCCSNEDTSERFLIRCWRDTNASVKNKTNNKTNELLVARRGTGWVEVFFKMVVAGDESDIGLPTKGARLDEFLRLEDQLWPHEP